jgi:hypothetical protein
MAGKPKSGGMGHQAQSGLQWDSMTTVIHILRKNSGFLLVINLTFRKVA